MIRSVVSRSEVDIPPEIGSDVDEEAGTRERMRERPARERMPHPQPASAPSQHVRTSLFTLLRSRNGLRQALVLQEIIGPPKG